jgi:ribonuclease P/MRP protein subunit RPP40
MAKHFPTVTSCAPSVLTSFNVAMPRMQPPLEVRSKYEDEFTDFSCDLYEWLSLISLQSPRIGIDDRIDPFLSRYSPPRSEANDIDVSELVKVTWQGFLSAPWAHGILVKAMLAASPKTWFSLGVCGFGESVSDSRDCTILNLPGSSNEYLLWEIEGGS